MHLKNFRFVNKYKCLPIVVATIPFSLLIAGCSLEANILSLKTEVNKTFFKTGASELTTGSSQNEYTTRGYKIQSSVSYQNSKPMALTGRGYKAYTNIQGTIFKE